MIKNYEMVIGLEVHVELKTKTKIFCGCPADFGAEPNTQCCPICMGMPGTLPVLNAQVVDYAIKAGLATNCTIARYSKQDRKHYFYPDLPKAYQISQLDMPLCTGGHLLIETPGGQKKIGITRIHIEEDAGKLVHDDELGTLFDCNRGGTPLIEIVSEPDIRSAEEAVAYLQKLRAIILYTGVSDVKMNEGSMRCDVNLSVRQMGEEKLGVRTEMKNLNSFQSVQKAIEYEYKRQVEAVENGEAIVQETRRFDQATGKTYSMRSKENASDYRYFPDPNLAPTIVTEEKLESLRAQIPQLPDERKQQYVERYGLTRYGSELLTVQKEIADYFEEACAATAHAKALANLITTEVFRLLPPEATAVPIAPAHMAHIATMLGEGHINSGTAKRVLTELWERDRDPEALVREKGWQQINDEKALSRLVRDVIEGNAKAVADYRSGKEASFKALMGQVMARTQGQGNAVLIQELMRKELAKQA